MKNNLLAQILARLPAPSDAQPARRSGLSRRKRIATLIAIMGALAFPLAPRTVGAEAAPIPFSATLNEKHDRLDCHFRLLEPEEVQKVTAKIAGRPVADVTFQDFSGTKGSVAFLFMIDQCTRTQQQLGAAAGVGYDPKPFPSIIEPSKRLITDFSAYAPGQRIAVDGFAGNKTVSLVPFTAGADLSGRLKPLILESKSETPELVTCIRAALRQLEQESAQRKALIILSGGATSDNPLEAQSLLDEAKKAGVSIFTYGFDGRKDSPGATKPKPQSRLESELRNLSFLSSHTDGNHWDQPYALAKDYQDKVFTDELLKVSMSGGTAGIDVRGAKEGELLELEITTKSNNVIHYMHTLTAGPFAELAKVEKPTTPAISPPAKVEVKAIATPPPPIRGWTPYAIPGGIAFILGVVIWLIARPSRDLPREPAPPSPEPMAAPSPQAPRSASPSARPEEAPGTRVLREQFFARLRVLEGDATPEYRICSSITNIGRGKDNHMVLRNDSVSRKHAAIHRQPDGTFIITEVDAKNGVGINGSKVAKGLLKHEDTIELGDVQLQFLEP